MRRIGMAAITAVLVLSGCGSKQVEEQEETIRVKVEQASRSTDSFVTPYVGVVEEESSTMVSFTGMAMLQRVTVSEGQQVHKGQLLAVIDDTQARNALTAAKAALDQAKDAEARMKQLHESGSLPDMQWVEVQSKVQQAQASYDLCQKNLRDCSLYAPVSGVVGQKVMGVGETVLPTEPVLTILNINTVKVRVAIPEKEVAAITATTPTEITVEALGNETFRGGRIEKGVTADPLTHTYDIRITLPNPGQKLLPGMVARVKMRNGENEKMRNDGLTLPVKAVQQATDKTLFVWTVNDGKAHRTPVTIGQTTGNRVVIESGIDESSQVIVEGYQKLGEGTPIAYGME